MPKIEELKAGDSVFVKCGIETLSLTQVERVLKNLIIVDGVRYNRKTGYATGERTAWLRSYIRFADPESIVIWEAKQFQLKLAHRFCAYVEGNFNVIRNLAAEKLIALLKILEEST
jgi:hypothetical protein